MIRNQIRRGNPSAANVGGKGYLTPVALTRPNSTPYSRRHQARPSRLANRSTAARTSAGRAAV